MYTAAQQVNLAEPNSHLFGCAVSRPEVNTFA